jgi:hypothetical protein
VTVLRAAEARTLTARRYDVTVVLRSGGAVRVEHLDINAPDEVALLRTPTGPPVEIDVGAARYLAEGPGATVYQRTTAVPPSGPLGALPTEAVDLLASETPISWLGQFRYVPREAPVPRFLRNWVGAARARIAVSARVSSGYLVGESVSAAARGRVVTAVVSFTDVDRAAPIPVPRT